MGAIGVPRAHRRAPRGRPRRRSAGRRGVARVQACPAGLGPSAAWASRPSTISAFVRRPRVRAGRPGAVRALCRAPVLPLHCPYARALARRYAVRPLRARPPLRRRAARRTAAGRGRWPRPPGCCRAGACSRMSGLLRSVPPLNCRTVGPPSLSMRSIRPCPPGPEPGQASGRDELLASWLRRRWCPRRSSRASPRCSLRYAGLKLAGPRTAALHQPLGARAPTATRSCCSASWDGTGCLDADVLPGGCSPPRPVAAAVGGVVVDQERDQDHQGEHEAADRERDEDAGLAVVGVGLHGVAFQAVG